VFIHFFVRRLLVLEKPHCVTIFDTNCDFSKGFFDVSA
jgi:hypothetical protein